MQGAGHQLLGIARSRIYLWRGMAVLTMRSNNNWGGLSPGLL